MKRSWVVRSGDWVRLFDHEPSDADLVEAIRHEHQQLSLVISIFPSGSDPIESTRIVATVPFLLDHGLIDVDTARRHLSEVLGHPAPKEVRISLSAD